MTKKITELDTGVPDSADLIEYVDVSDTTEAPTGTNKKSLISSLGGGGAPEGTAVLSTGEVGAVKFLREDGDGTCSWQTPAGSGDVIKVGTPVDNQVGVWTGDGTIEGTTGLTYDGSNFLLTGDIGLTGTRITKGWFTDLEVTNNIAGSITGNAATVTTITGLAPDTATTQATQGSITTCTNLVTVGTIGTGTWQGDAITDTYISSASAWNAKMDDLVDDTTPELSGTLESNNNDITEIKTGSFNSEVDNGSKTGNHTIAFSSGQKQKVTLTANTILQTYTFPGVGNYILKIVNGGLSTLSYAVTGGSAVFIGGVAPTLTSSGTDILAIYYDGTDAYFVASLDLS